MSLKLSALTIILTLISASLFAQEFPATPNQWVADYADILSNNEEQTLNNMLRTYEDTTSNQIIVATFQNAQGYPVEQFTIQLAEKWKIGQQNRDNGVIMAVFVEEHKIRMEVGYGLEDMVPDAIAFQISQNVIPPYFREGNYYQGLQAGAQALMQAAAGKYEGIKDKSSKQDDGSSFPWAFIVFLLIVVFSSFRRRRSRATVGSRGWHWAGPFFFGGFGGGSGRGGFGGFGGGGGGGFSAGGGSFGGGGATGSW